MTATPPPAPLTPLQIESLVASIGMAPFVARKPKIHGHHATRADAMPAEIARKIHLFLNREEPAPAAPLPPFDFKAVVADLDAPVLPEHVMQEIAAFGEAGEAALAANLVVQRIRTYVEQKVPRRVYLGLQGPEPGDPPRSDVARFRRLWAIACDPLTILDDLNEYNVSRDQVTACSEMFPLLWGTFWPITQAQFVRRAGVAPGYRLSRRKERILRVLTKQEAPNLPLARALQAIFAEDAAAMAPAPAPPAPVKKDAIDESTPAQRITST